MEQFLRRIEDERNLLVELMALYNSGQIEPFLTEHLDEVAFMTPDGSGTRRHGSGKVALREDIRRFRGERGRLNVLDVLPADDSISLLVDDELRNRIVFCLKMHCNRRIERVTAFDVVPQPGWDALASRTYGRMSLAVPST